MTENRSATDLSETREEHAVWTEHGMRKRGLARTRYWEPRGDGEPAPSPRARAPLDSGDPILDAVQAVKRQLLNAGITQSLPTPQRLQLLAACAKPRPAKHTEAAARTQLGLIALGTFLLLACALAARQLL